MLNFNFSVNDKPIDFQINPQNFTLTAEQMLDNPAGAATTMLTPITGAIGVFATAVISIKLIQAIIESLQK